MGFVQATIFIFFNLFFVFNLSEAVGYARLSVQWYYRIVQTVLEHTYPGHYSTHY